MRGSNTGRDKGKEGARIRQVVMDRAPGERRGWRDGGMEGWRQMETELSFPGERNTRSEI